MKNLQVSSENLLSDIEEIKKFLVLQNRKIVKITSPLEYSQLSGKSLTSSFAWDSAFPCKMIKVSEKVTAPKIFTSQKYIQLPVISDQLIPKCFCSESAACASSVEERRIYFLRENWKKIERVRTLQKGYQNDYIGAFGHYLFPLSLLFWKTSEFCKGFYSWRKYFTFGKLSSASFWTQWKDSRYKSDQLNNQLLRCLTDYKAKYPEDDFSNLPLK